MGNLAEILGKKSTTSARPTTDALLEQIAGERVDAFLKDLAPAILKKVDDVLAEAKKKALKGDKGDKGAPGETPTARELQNLIEPLIPDPIPGPKGADSTVPGPKGDKGDQGAPGINGKDGSPDTPDQVVRKVNKASKKVSQAAVAGLPEALTSLRKAVNTRQRGGGGSGGGMGNLTHQHTSISSATTTVSTTYKIGGGGFALWVFYNGGMIARGTDYTVGTDQKTLTLLFTPQDNTVIDIVYIRT